MIAKALTIAGSDSSGGAGIQADLKTFARVGVYGMSVITALTAQNTVEVSGVLETPAAFVACQLDSVVSDIRPDAVKTGMLGTAAIIEVVAAKIREYQLLNLVVDPVMVSTSGAPLLQAQAIDIFRRALLPLALIITPNIDEAALLGGKRIVTPDDMEEAALAIHGMGARNVLLKGGHMEGDAIDVLFDGSNFVHLKAPRIETRDSHGTGCVLSSAIAGRLALGDSVQSAVRFGKELVTEAIRNGLRIGAGRGPCNPLGSGVSWQSK